MMPMKKSNYIGLIITAILCLIVFSSCSFAALDTSLIQEHFSTTPEELPSTKAMGQTILSILTIIGYSLAVVTILFTGIKFIIASPQQKAILKEKLWLILIGVIFLAGGTPILQLIMNIMSDASDTL